MNKKYPYSLKKKTMLVMIIAFAVVGAVGIGLFYKGAYDIARSEYVTHCSDLANTVAHSIDDAKVKAVGDRVLKIYRSLPSSECMVSAQDGEPGYDEYLDHYSGVEKMEEFKSIRKSLRRIQDLSHVDCLYIIYPDTKTHRIIYLVDGAYEDVWDPGTLEVLYDTDFKEKGNVRSGFGTLMSDTDDGNKMVTTAMPIFDDKKNLIAYAGLDYSIESLLEDQRNMILFAILMILLLAALSAFIVIKLVDRAIVKPINALSDASVRYYADDSDGTRKANRFSDLNIHTGDEIETLADSMSKMEQDIDNHIQALLSTKSELNNTKEYAEEMERSANVDALTGVRNKRAYEAEINDLDIDIMTMEARFGIAVIDMDDLKLLNDKYGHECGDAAIVEMCNIICDVFRHSPVFRFGGDEFAVILKGRDLDNYDTLAARFADDLKALRNNEELEPWLRINASIGFALYDPDLDKDADNVFKRADKAMYTFKDDNKKS